MMTPLAGLSPTDAGGPTGLTSPATSAGGDFAAMFAQVAGEARDTLRTAEATAIAGVSGKASVQDVVQTMMGAEQQLRAAIAVRDRVVAAYQEISRMQI